MNPIRGRLQDRVIVVVGGTTGLGLSGAAAIVAAGGRVVVVGRNPEHARAAGEQLGADCVSITGDATRPETAANAVATALREFGRFDGLYHVAGGSGRRFGDGPLHEITDEGWEKTMDLNLKALFHSNRAAVRQFLDQQTGGSVLNMGSVLGFSPSPKYFATHTYAAAKAAVVGLTRSAASYYAKDGIRFNVVAPALVATPMSRRARENEEIIRFITTKQPLDGGRIGAPDDLDAAVVFFLSDESKFVTGQTLDVDGGWSVSEGRVE